MQFVARGYKVAKVDQMETQTGKSMREKDVAVKEKVIRRELTAVLTAGTLVDSAFLIKDQATYCLCLVESSESAWPTTKEMHTNLGVCFVDTSTAHVWVSKFSDDSSRSRLETLLMQIQPKEIVVDQSCISTSTLKLIRSLCPGALWNNTTFWEPEETRALLKEKGIWTERPGALGQHFENNTVMKSIGGLIMYLQRLKLDHLLQANQISEYDMQRSSTCLVLDGATLLNLNVLDGERNLYSLVDQCTTPMGRRLLRSWVSHPLRQSQDIQQRQDAVVEWLHHPDRAELSARMKRIPDLERVLGRLQMRCCKLKDFIGALNGFRIIQQIFTDLRMLNLEAGRNVHLVAAYPDLADQLLYFETAFDHSAALISGSIEPRPGVLEEYDTVMAAIKQLEEELDSHLLASRQKLRVAAQYKDTGKDKNQIEVPIHAKVPTTWKKISGTKSVARYHSPEVLILNERMSEAVEVKTNILKEATKRVLDLFVESISSWRTACEFVAELDTLVGLATVATTQGFSCIPDIVDDEEAWVSVQKLRHPSFANDPNFIPNDIVLGGPSATKHSRTMLLTGSNMGGKTTAMRSIGLAVVLAQLGSLIPAESCRVSPFDSIYTRIGARDNLVQGQSTFMVELQETSRILQGATSRSLVLCDELGRGTSTFDGHAIAFSVLQHLAYRLQPCLMFSTHYTDLTLEFDARNANPVVENWHMACLEDPDNRAVTFLYILSKGAVSKSHGVHVARMAGLPETVVAHADRVAKGFHVSNQCKPDSISDALKKVNMLAFGNLATLFACKDLNNESLKVLKAVQQSVE
jgi:DNA mismatch repair protein MSH6